MHICLCNKKKIFVSLKFKKEEERVVLYFCLETALDNRGHVNLPAFFGHNYWQSYADIIRYNLIVSRRNFCAFNA